MDRIQRTEGKNSRSKLGIGILIITVIVLFSTLGSAYMRANKTVEIQLPLLFYINTLILLISSACLHLSWVSKAGIKGKNLVLATLMLGIGFLIGQGFAWSMLYAQGIDIAMSGRQASYLYLMTGLHAVHIIGGLGFIAFVYFTFEKKGKSYLESALFFWHFLGLLWIYLICLLLI